LRQAAPGGGRAVFAPELQAFIGNNWGRLMGIWGIMRFLAKNSGRKAGQAVCLLLAAFAWHNAAQAQSVNFGINLSGGKEPVKIDADAMEMHDKDGVAILTGNVSVAQGDRILRAGKMLVYYRKAAAQGDVRAERSNKAALKAAARPGNSLGAGGIDRLEVSDKVYIKNGKQIAVGDKGLFNADTNIMTLTGAKVVLTDGENVATGCKLVAHMDSGKAFLESCSSAQQKGRVSVIVNRDGQN